MNILFVTDEIAPITGETSPGRVVAQLGGALCLLGHKVTVCLPLQSPQIVEQLSLARRLSPLAVPFPQAEIQLHVYDGRLPSGVELRLLGNEKHFRMPSEAGSDEPLRQALLARGSALLAAESCAAGQWHLVHSFTLAAAMTSFFASTMPPLAKAKTFFSVHSLERQGVCDKSWVEKLGLGWENFTPDTFEYYGKLNPLKAGLVTSDRILFDSASRLLDCSSPDGGFGLEGVLQTNRKKACVLLPGLNYSRWNPATDVELAAHYDAEKTGSKVSCKAHLQNLVGLPVRPQIPLLALAPPLTEMAEPLARVLDRVLRDEVQLLAPSGLAGPLPGALEELQARWPRRIARVELSSGLWRQILAGADLLLLDAPRGPEADDLLAALRYGALPVTQRAGSARDLVVDCTNTLDSGNGFLLHDESADEIVAVLRRALAALRYGQPFRDLLTRAMSLSCSWEHRAQQLEQLYTETLPAVGSSNEPDSCIPSQ